MDTSSKPTDWTRTPAAGFAAVVLGVSSIAGLGWSLLVHEPAPAQAMQAVLIEHDTQDSGPLPSVVHLVDINAASSSELQLLPGIGPVTAAAIIADRSENGAFVDLDDLDRVHGIGPKTIEAIRDRARVPAGG